MKTFAKKTFLSFNTTTVFLHDVMVPENDVLEAGSAAGVFSWVTLSSDCRFQLQVERMSQTISIVVFVKSPLFNGTL